MAKCKSCGMTVYSNGGIITVEKTTRGGKVVERRMQRTLCPKCGKRGARYFSDKPKKKKSE